LGGEGLDRETSAVSDTSGRIHFCSVTGGFRSVDVAAITEIS